MSNSLPKVVEKHPEGFQKLYMKTYGCQMNIYDSERMAEILAPLGYRLIETPEDADMVILNTCHIREKAEEKVFSDLGRLKPFKQAKTSQGKSMILAVAGCVAQAQGKEIIRRAPYVDMVFGPQTYHLLPEMLAQAKRAVEKDKKGPGRGIVNLDFPVEAKFDFLPEATSAKGPTAFLTIQEGCDKFCTFCVVSYTRGAEYSRPASQILEEAKQLIARGAKELTLLGQNVNAYHGESPQGEEWNLGQLIYALAALPGLERLRYMTSHPNDMHEDLIAAHRDVAILMPFLHLPVQSGSPAVLKRMNRRHDVPFYLKWIETLRKARPDIAFSSDFIVGFPGETDADFEQTLALVKEVGYAQAYSFKYSPRPGTPGALYEDQVSETVKDQRLKTLQDALNQQQVAYNQTMVGTNLPILFEKKGRTPNQWIGRSPHMQSVYVESPRNLVGKTLWVTINQGFSNSLSGTLAGV